MIFLFFQAVCFPVVLVVQGIIHLLWIFSFQILLIDQYLRIHFPAGPGLQIN